MLEQIVIARVVAESALLAGVLSVASITDLRDRRIPNHLTYGAFLASVLIAVGVAISGADPGAFHERIVGFSTSFGLMLVAYMTIGIGAGDVKLAGVLGGLLGLRSGLEIIILAHMVGGLFAVGLIAYRIGPVWMGSKVLATCMPGSYPQPVFDKKKLAYPIPMAVFFSIGTLLCLSGVRVL